jgi:hypothetical protein
MIQSLMPSSLGHWMLRDLQQVNGRRDIFEPFTLTTIIEVDQAIFNLGTVHVAFWRWNWQYRRGHHSLMLDQTRYERVLLIC